MVDVRYMERDDVSICQDLWVFLLLVVVVVFLICWDDESSVHRTWCNAVVTCRVLISMY